MPFVKIDRGIIIIEEKSVLNKNYRLTSDNVKRVKFPVDGWYWVNNIEEAAELDGFDTVENKEDVIKPEIKDYLTYTDKYVVAYIDEKGELTATILDDLSEASDLNTVTRPTVITKGDIERSVATNRNIRIKIDPDVVDPVKVRIGSK